MYRRMVGAALVALSSVATAQGRAGIPAGQTRDPFPQPIVADQDVITVTLREFASLPNIDSVAARAMTLVDEPTTRRLFVSDMHGLLYVVSPDGRTVTQYLDLRDAKWGVGVQSRGRERGLQSFTLHPQFAQAGAPGFGKFYTYTDVSNQAPAPDFTTPNAATTHDLVLLEWTAKTPGAAMYDGAGPREIIRWRQPFQNHNGGAIAFNSTARAGTPEFGLLYVSVADGGSGGDPMNLAQNLESSFGKILRIDPLGTNGRNGKYGVPASNPLVTRANALPEIYAYGIRNSQRLGWDSRNGAMYISDIGQNVVEEVSPVTAGANLGWNAWEGSFRFMPSRAVLVDSTRSDPAVTFPIVEWDQLDPILLRSNSSASVGAAIYRSTVVPQLNGRLLFGDMPSGELFHVNADQLPKGGQDPIRRVLFVTATGQAPRTFLQIIQEKNTAQGKTPATRADLRFDVTATGHIFLLNKADGTIRVIER
jgi:glucose/arabinose dehydrogenase